MESFVDRMIAEHRELNERIFKLKEFIKSEKFDTLNSENQSLLYAQLHAMETYCIILTRRIKINTNFGEQK